MSTPAEVRAAMAASINADFNKLVDAGQITGVEKIPVAGAPAPVAEPTAPAATTAPVVEAPVPAVAPVAAPAIPADYAGLVGENGLLLNKYRTVDELKKGYFNAVNTLSATLDENSSLRQAQTVAPSVPATVPGSAPGAAPRVNPAARQTIGIDDPVLAKLAEESNISPELFVQAVDRVASLRAEEIAQQTVREYVEPRERLTEAEGAFRTKYPEAINHQVEFGNFLKVTPDVAATAATLYQVNPLQAMEYAYQMYRAQSGFVAERKMQGNAAVAEEERIAARAEAGLPTSPNTGVLSALPNTAAPSAEEIQAMNAAAGHGLSQDQAAVLRRRRMLASQLPPELRTWENQR